MRFVEFELAEGHSLTGSIWINPDTVTAVKELPNSQQVAIFVTNGDVRVKDSLNQVFRKLTHKEETNGV